MVASGLVHRVEVAQERLAIHLMLAALIFSACLWVAGGLGPRARSIVHEGAAAAIGGGAHDPRAGLRADRSPAGSSPGCAPDLSTTLGR